MAPAKPPLPGESANAYHRRITSAEGLRAPAIEPTEELQLAEPKRRGRPLTEAEKIAVAVAKYLTIASSIFTAGWVANERVGKVLVEQIAIKEEQTAQRKLLEQAVTKEYFSWKMEQASDACYTRAIAKVYDARIAVLCPNFPTRGKPYICHLLQQ